MTVSSPDIYGRPGRAAPEAYNVSTRQYASSPDITLGSFRQGDALTIQFYLPNQTSTPSASISGPNGPVAIPMTTRDGVLFLLAQILTAAWPIGSYVLTVGSQIFRFTIVAGGDPSGEIMAIYATKNVQGWQVLAQLQSGRLVLGKNPEVA